MRVEYHGKTYRSIAALARAYRLKENTAYYRLRKGIPLDAPLIKDGTHYDKAKEAKRVFRKWQPHFLSSNGLSVDQGIAAINRIMQRSGASESN